MTHRRWLVCLGIAALPLGAQEGAQFGELAGWWSADPVHGGESSHIALELRDKDGRPEARLWLTAIGASDIPLGTVSITGNTLDTKPLAFPLTWNPATQTLSGHIPADAAPVYRIPIEFKRGGPLEMPVPKEWQAPVPAVRALHDFPAAVWAGLDRDEKSGLVIVGTEEGRVSAISRSGDVRWQLDTGKPIRGQPKIIGEHVYAASDSGFLHKLKTRTGKQAWRARVDAGSPARIPTDKPGTRWDRYGSSVIADAKRVYYASRDKNLYALDVNTGQVVWRVTAGDIMTATPALHADTVIFAAFDGKVQAVAAADGAPRWSYDARLAVPGDVVVADHRVLLGSRSYDLIALDAASGKELWKRYYWFSWIESPPVVRDGVVYTGSSDATSVYAINLADGSLKWKRPVPGYSWQRPAVSEEFVVVGTVGQGEYPGNRAGSLVALERETGRVRWMYLEPPSEEVAKSKQSWGFGAAPVFGKGVVYAVDLEGRLAEFGLKSR